MSRYDEYEEEHFFRRNRIAIGLGLAVVLLAGVVLSAYLLSSKPAPPRPPQEIVVHLEPPPLPPPPPPPAPPKTPPPEPKMVEPPVKPREAKPKQEAKVDKPPGPPGPKASGPPSDIGLGGAGENGNGIGNGNNGGSKFGWYASEVQARIADAFRQNDKTREANIKLKVRIWVDGTGRITRADLVDSTGDSTIDAAIRNEVLIGLVLQEPPPQDMPMPIVMRVTARRPA